MLLVLTPSCYCIPEGLPLLNVSLNRLICGGLPMTTGLLGELENSPLKCRIGDVLLG
jgi:hypothetical protein